MAKTPFEEGAAGNLNGERPQNWQTSDQQIAEQQAKFDQFRSEGSAVPTTIDELMNAGGG